MSLLTQQEQERLQAILAELKRRKSKDLNFTQWLQEVSPLFTWDWAHLKYIRKYLAEIKPGASKKLMIFCPPRHGKSEMATVRYPGWFLEKNPDNRVIVGC
jgi:hypothetical protein